MKQFLKLKGLFESEDGGKTWFASRIDYLSGADSQHDEYDFIEVPEDWKPCQLILGKVEK